MIAVKITPTNQTLILASERRGSSNLTGATSASKAGATGSTLSRVTIVATQPDTTVVYLRADYTPSRTLTSNGVTAAPRASANPSYAVTSSSTGTSSYSGTSSSSYLNLKPAEQYAFTQRILSLAPVVQHIDAYA